MTFLGTVFEESNNKLKHLENKDAYKLEVIQGSEEEKQKMIVEIMAL